MTIQFNVRYILRTGLLEMIKEYANPVVMLGWSDDELKQELESKGSEVVELPRPITNKSYETIRQKINFLHQKQINSPSQKIDKQRADLERSLPQRFFRNIQGLMLQSELSLPGASKEIFDKEKESLFNNTNFRSIVETIRQLGIDAVFCLTPYIRNEEFVLRAAELLRIPMCTSILSFDNLTTRGWIPVTFNQYFLWNKYNEQELRRIYPRTINCPVTIVGAPQFDFYYDRNFLWDEAYWRKQLSIPLDRPVILFGGGPPVITRMESYWVSQIDSAIESKWIRNQPIILVRPHPLDRVENWTFAIKETKNVFLDFPWNVRGNPGLTNIKIFDIQKLASSLYHSDIHINTSSTMTLDGAIFDRPQIGPAYDDRPGGKYDLASRALYQREHYLPITNSGGLEIVYSVSELVKAINDAMLTPEKMKLGREKMVREICSFNDGRSTERVNYALYSFMQNI